MELTAFRGLVSEEDFGRVTRYIDSAITKTLDEDKMSVVTRAEIKRRFELCAKILTVILGDVKWGIKKALDHLYPYLRMELNGEDWTAAATDEDKRNSWIVQEPVSAPEG